jgi:hypothetical protein
MDKYEEETRKQYQEYITREHNGLEVKQRKVKTHPKGSKTRRDISGFRKPRGDGSGNGL